MVSGASPGLGGARLEVILFNKQFGAVAELADALDLGSSFSGSAGSIPVSPTFSLLRLSHNRLGDH